MRPEIFFQKVQHVIVKVTDGCNLSCRYCKVNAVNQSYSRMSIQTAKRIAKLLIENSEFHKTCFNLHGGEPLLMTDEWICNVLLYANDLAAKHSKTVSFPLTTNGSLLDEHRIDKLHDAGIGFSISCDGPPYIHNTMREQGAKAFKSIQMLINKKIPFNVLLVVNPMNYNRLLEIMDWFSSIGVKEFSSNFLTPQGRSAGELLSAKEMFESGKQILEHMYFTNLSVRNKLFEHIVAWYVNGKKPINTMTCYQSQCIAGRNVVMVDVNGDLIPCGAVESNTFLIGDIHNNVEENQYLSVLKQFHGEKKYYSKCQECKINHICFHGCTAASNASMHYKENHCQFTKLMWAYFKANPDIPNKIYNGLVTRSSIHIQ